MTTAKFDWMLHLLKGYSRERMHSELAALRSFRRRMRDMDEQGEML